MKFRKGDRVKFLNDVGTGVILDFPDQYTALILRDDGFEVPVLVKELIAVSGRGLEEWKEEWEEKAEADSLPGKETDGPGQPGKKEKGSVIERDMDIYPLKETEQTVPAEYFPPKVLLAWVADRKKGRYVLYLINNGDLYLLYLVRSRENGDYRLLRVGQLEPGTKVRLLKCPAMEFEKLEDVSARVLVFHPGALTPDYPPMEGRWERGSRKAAVELMFRETEYFEEPAWITELKTAEKATGRKGMLLEQWQEERQRAARNENRREAGKGRKKEPGKLPGSPVEEVDLHLESIVDHSESLEPAEALEIQKNRFITALEGGIRNGVKKMVFIHGVGDGKLKYEIRRIIDRQYPRLRYQDASFKEYGYGATLVLIPGNTRH